MVLEQLDIHMQKKLDTDLIPFKHKKTLKMDHNLNIKCKTIKLLEENIHYYLVNHSKIFCLKNDSYSL